MTDANALSNQTTPPVTPAQTTATQTTPQSSAPNKEHAPAAIQPTESAPELIKAEITQGASPEIKIPSELKEVIHASPEGKEIQIEKVSAPPQPTPVTTPEPIITTPEGTIKLPMNYAQALQKIKQSRILDSSHWLAALIMYQWSKYEPELIKEAKRNKTT